MSSQTTLVVDSSTALTLRDFWSLNEGEDSEIQTLEMVGDSFLEDQYREPFPACFAYNVKRILFIGDYVEFVKAPNVKFVEVRNCGEDDADVEGMYPEAVVWNHPFSSKSIPPPDWVH